MQHIIKQSIRNLNHNRLLSILNIGSFAMGFAVCMVLALYIYKENNVDKGFANYANLYRIIDTKRNSSRVDYDLAENLKNQYPDIIRTVPVNYFSFGEQKVFLKKLQGEDFIQPKAIISTTNNFFKAFSIPIINGANESPFTDLNSVVITKNIALKLFGKTDIIGEIINFGGIFKIPISAVCDDLPENTSINADVFFNAENENVRFSRSKHAGVIYNPVDIYIQLKTNVDANRFASLINQKFPTNKMSTDKIRLQPLANIYLSKEIDGNTNKTGSPVIINIFFSIGLLILLLSVINYVNLSISKQLATLKDIAIKVTNGAGTKQLCAYYFINVSLSVILAILLAIGITSLILPFASHLLGTSLKMKWLTTPILISVLTTIVLSVILISSIIPVYIISKFDIQRLLGKKQLARTKLLGKKTLTIFQLSASILLLSGLMVMQKQMKFVKAKDLGFNKEHLVRIDFNRDANTINSLKQQFDQLPFVKNSSLSNGAPGCIYMEKSSNRPDNENFELDCIYGDDLFLKTFDIHLIQGRSFQPYDIDNACYINETAYKKFGWDNLENRKLNNGKEGEYSVIGVVKDFNVASLHSSIRPVCIINKARYTCISVKLIPGNTYLQMQQIKNIWTDFFPDEPMRFTFYDSYFDTFYKKEERESKAIASFSFIAFIITCMGLFGQVYHTTNMRIKEIGIRKINGAKIAEILTILNKDFVKWVTISIGIATPIAWYAMDKWLENFAYKTTMSWWIFALAGLLAMGIALLTVSWQSWKAATKNPIEALRYE